MQALRSFFRPAAIALALAACSSSSPSGSGGFDAPTCAAGTAQLSGAVGSDALSASGTPSTMLDQLSTPSKLSLSFSGNDLELHWNGLQADGQPFVAGGTLTSGGAVYCAGQGTQVELTSSGGRFVLGLSPQQAGTSCSPDAPATGTVKGCWADAH